MKSKPNIVMKTPVGLTLESPRHATPTRSQAEARRVINERFPFKCCAVCGLQVATCLTIAHLDHNPSNNGPDNLARLCWTHHWMYDCGFYPMEAIRLLQEHWQMTRGEPNHKARMKDAGAKAALIRKRKAAARKAVVTRKQRVAGSSQR